MESLDEQLSAQLSKHMSLNRKTGPEPPPKPKKTLDEPRKLSLNNSLDLQMQKEALEHHKKMLENQQLIQPNNTRFYGAATQNPIVGGAELSGSSRIYENTAPSVTLTPKVNAQSQQHIGYDGLIYSNIIHDQDDDLPPPPLDFQTSDTIGEENTLSSLNCSDLASEEELPPPSPVSSSYSELRRAIDNKNYQPLPPPNSSYHHHGNTSTAEYANLPPPIPSQSILHTVGGGSYRASNHDDDFQSQLGASSTSDTNPQSFYGGLSNYNADYGTYGPLSQSSSTYESIYEPITPRNSSQMSNRPNYSIYAPYSSGTGTNSGVATPTPSMMNNGNKPKESVVDQLTNLLMQSLNHGEQEDSESFGVCVKCDIRVVGENMGCTAMDKIYHVKCFICCVCQINLQGKPFYALEGRPYCEEDYMDTLEKCSVCLTPILERILRATGKPYHPGCFCCVCCGKSLDGIPFTVDATNQIFCIEDFHKKFAPRCYFCKFPILPDPGEDETVRVVALDRSFHIACYKCEDCGLLLSSEADGRGCYPLDNHILCRSCNAKRVQALTSHMTTEL